MMQRIIEQSHGHPLKNHKILLPNEFSCNPYSQGKLIVRPSFNKIMSESPVFLERIHGNIYGPIHPPCGPFLTRPDPDTLPGFPGWSRLVKSHCIIPREYPMEPHFKKESKHMH